MHYKYAIGQQVRIRKDLNTEVDYSMFYNDDVVSEFHPDMTKWCGKTVTISGYDRNRYIIQEDARWRWTDEMFEDEAAEQVIERIKHKTIVRIVDEEEGEHEKYVTVRLDDGEVYHIIVANLYKKMSGLQIAEEGKRVGHDLKIRLSDGEIVFIPLEGEEDEL